jgi:peroxiredoxin
MNLALVVEPYPAPLFATETAQGRKIKMGDFKGKLVILNFWTTWCPPCRLEMPSMERLYRDFKGDGLEIVAANFMESKDSINSFVNENGFTFKVLLDRDGDIAQKYGVHALPVTFVIGRDGKVLAKSFGYKDWYSEETQKLVASLLKDDSVLRGGKTIQTRASLWPLDRREGLIIFGIAVLVLLFASALGFRKGWLRDK